MTTRFYTRILFAAYLDPGFRIRTRLDQHNGTFQLPPRTTCRNVLSLRYTISLFGVMPGRNSPASAERLAYLSSPVTERDDDSFVRAAPRHRLFALRALPRPSSATRAHEHPIVRLGSCLTRDITGDAFATRAHGRDAGMNLYQRDMRSHTPPNRSQTPCLHYFLPRSCLARMAFT